MTAGTTLMVKRSHFHRESYNYLEKGFAWQAANSSKNHECFFLIQQNRFPRDRSLVFAVTEETLLVISWDRRDSECAAKK